MLVKLINCLIKYIFIFVSGLSFLHYKKKIRDSIEIKVAMGVEVEKRLGIPDLDTVIDSIFGQQ